MLLGLFSSFGEWGPLSSCGAPASPDVELGLKGGQAL